MHYFFTFCFLAFFAHSCNSQIREGTDLTSLSNYETVDSDENSENLEDQDAAASVIVDELSESAIADICKNLNEVVYVKQEDVTIDCKTINSKPLEKPADVVKRSAENNVEVEGSGSPPEEETTMAKADEEIPTEEAKQTPEAPKEGSDAEMPKKEIQESTITEPAKPAEAPEEAPDSNITEATTVAPPTEAPEKEIQDSTTIKTPIGSEPYENEDKIDDVKEEQEDMDKKDDVIEEDPNKEVTDVPNVKNDKPDQKSMEIKDNSHQGIKGKTLIDTREKSPEDENNDDASVKADESSKNTQKGGSKDTTILVFLFVAVLVVGGLAFGYNYIKKRKQRSEDLERVEKGSIRRSLNNLTKTEGEVEKKPLMGNDKEVEMVDMKKENSTQEETEKATSNNTEESIVKT